MKHMLKRLLALTLAVCLLAGCSGGKEPSPEAGGDGSPISRITGLDYHTKVAEVNGHDVAAETYLFLLFNTIESQMYYYLALGLEWTQEQKDAVKKQALDSAALFWVIQDKAQEMGIALTDAQRAEIEADLAATAEQLGGEEAFARELAGVCLSREGYARICEINYLNQGLMDKLSAEGALDASAQDVEDHISKNGLYAAKHILLSTQDRDPETGESIPYTDEQKAEVEARAQELYQSILASDDPAEAFDQLMNQHSEDGRNEIGELYYPDGYTLVHPGDMVPQFESGALSLKEGEIGAPVETDYGYHIIMRIPVDREEALGECSGQAKFTTILNQWVAQATVTTTGALDALDPVAFYDGLTAIHEEWAAAEATPQPETEPVG